MVNKVILIGRVGKDPEIRTISNGVKTASFSLATTEKYKDKEGKMQEKTQWHNIQAWEKKAELAEKFIKKGQILYVEGKLEYNTYEKEGIKHDISKITVRDLCFLSPKNSDENTKKNARQTASAKEEQQVDDDFGEGSSIDDLPF